MWLWLWSLYNLYLGPYQFNYCFELCSCCVHPSASTSILILSFCRFCNISLPPFLSLPFLFWHLFITKVCHCAIDFEPISLTFSLMMRKFEYKFFNKLYKIFIIKSCLMTISIKPLHAHKLSQMERILICL